ncbi:helicase-related protein [Pedobacter sp. AJM]|uniref:helicase-related protein n=1 Tax=Pedobacter sp. AJM TaxID=2003629 RepID=UPI000B4A64EC|nr:helicase-related protein [Pedobacter sp. AJM]OWK69066.1 helicase [Pedobacter sp. AJM]
MANNFITNNKGQKTLKGRLNTLIGISEELKFLVGFFYFSGWKELFESLRKNNKLTLKLLVGLQVCQHLHKALEFADDDEQLSGDEQFQNFITSLGFALNNEEMDSEELYTQVEFFLQMIDGGRLIIKKTQNPNHAKLYLFRLNQDQAELQDMDGQFVTGSSNLTRAGLSGQEEFNVEIKDYGFIEAETYFDELWEKAVPISEEEERKTFLIEFVKHKTQVAPVTPFEAYVLILKTYLDLQLQKQIKPEIENLLENIGFKNYAYQTDAVNQALTIIQEYNGVIVADVVGLGKSVIASLIAKNIGKRGMVICPPGLIGDKIYHTGWWEYIEKFKLYDWDVQSRGRLEEIAETIDNNGIDVLIIDEAHYFRNQDTADYEALLNICRNRIVILLTATPFNNSPADIFSLLKLFIIPGKSGITVEDNLEALFSNFNYRFKQFSIITKNYNSVNPEKRRKAELLYKVIIDEHLPIDIQKVRNATKTLANQIKQIISSVVIRRNRLDLKQDYIYAEEVRELSKVEDPIELFYELSPAQNTFYDAVVSEYFAEEGRFKGAIYQPFAYEKQVDDEEKLDEKGNRAYQQQRNLFDFMRRLLVKRFESSFGAFSKSIDRFLNVHILVRDFINKSGNQYILDRAFIEDIYKYTEEEIEAHLTKFAIGDLRKKTPKNTTVYQIDEFELKDEFFADIDSDIVIFEEIKAKLEVLNIVEHDPKRSEVTREIKEILAKDPNRKVILFSEYVDTIKHLEPYFRKEFGNRMLVCDGKVSKELATNLNSDFNAQYKAKQTNNFDLIITSDKLSEGFNLNRAGVIINYDIPWNPTRVIQRVGRINRIGTKVFDKLYIYNFFPTITGADIVKSREIAEQKMFLIHNSLGEDAKMFDEFEEPNASGLFKKINQNPDDEGELNVATLVRNQYRDIAEKYPEIITKIDQLPARVKSAKQFDSYQLNVLRKKGLSLFAQIIETKEDVNSEIQDIIFEDLLRNVVCEFEEPRLNLSGQFWMNYEKIKNHKPQAKGRTTQISLEQRALDNLKISLKLLNGYEESLIDFIKILLTDLRKYRTLSTRSIGRLARKPLAKGSSEKELKAFTDEVYWLKNHLGADYLEIILKRVDKYHNEVIISVENYCA